MSWCEVGLTSQAWEEALKAMHSGHSSYTKGPVGSKGIEGRKNSHSALSFRVMVYVKLLPVC